MANHWATPVTLPNIQRLTPERPWVHIATRLSGVWRENAMISSADNPSLATNETFSSPLRFIFGTGTTTCRANLGRHPNIQRWARFINRAESVSWRDKHSLPIRARIAAMNLFVD